MLNVAIDYDKLSAILEERQIQKGTLAKMIGVHPNTLISSFKRKTGIPTATVMKISEVLEVSPQSFVWSEDLDRFDQYSRLVDTSSRQIAENRFDESLNKLNTKGIQKAADFLELLAKVPEYQRSAETDEGDHP